MKNYIAYVTLGITGVNKRKEENNIWEKKTKGKYIERKKR